MAVIEARIAHVMFVGFAVATGTRPKTRMVLIFWHSTPLMPYCSEEEHMRVLPVSAVAAIATVVALIGSVSAGDVGPLIIAKQGYFFVGGRYFDTPNGKVMAGHAYVEYLIPEKRTHRFPLVMIAGGAMEGGTFTG